MAKSCEHLGGLRREDFPPQRTPTVCEECLAEGTVWVALRMLYVRPCRLLRFVERQARDQALS
jgi:hypothetical protein